jgi:four helix bundle protein
MFNFEKLEVWQKSIAFAELVYEVTRNFPTDERFGLTAQIMRASVSVPSNIAEGSARPPADFSKFLTYSTGSLYEVLTQATIAQKQGYLTSADHDKLKVSAAEISRMLSGLRTSLAK